jgi:hypothetical protein
VTGSGTLARTDMPPPGSVGLDAGSGSNAGLGDKVAAQAKRRAAQRVGDGECFALADQSLKAAGAQSAEDFGTITPDADYAWGTQTTVSDVRPGDIIQFRDYRYDRKITVTTDGNTRWSEDFQERPHHTAVVESVGGDGAITVLEQNAPQGSAVHRTTLFFKDIDSTAGGTTTKITIRGKFWIYHPQKK